MMFNSIFNTNHSGDSDSSQVKSDKTKDQKAKSSVKPTEEKIQDNAEENVIDLTDLPIEDPNNDKFGLKDSYVAALSDFIMNCDTPLTIAIQGSWGTGKTSLINMIKKYLPKEIKSVYFNTWQYSQFNMGEQLPLALLKGLIKELNINDDDINLILKGLNTFYRFVKNGALTLLDFKFGSRASGQAEKAINHIEAFFSEDSDVALSLKTLKEKLQQAINKKLGIENDTESKEKNEKRFVIFIDDLDRLSPVKAVELLEVLKLFFDCKHCVFVLAIDYSVVANGIKEKYNGFLDEKKGEQFFEKIIQLPFKMPVEQYDISNYVKGLLGKVIDNSKEVSTEDIENIIENTIDNNPRNIKRIFNSFALTLKIVNTKEESILKDCSENDLYASCIYFLFCVHCIQISHEDLYNYILKNIEGFVDNNGSLDAKKIDECSVETDEEKDESYDKAVQIFKNNIKLLIEKLRKKHTNNVAWIRTVLKNLISYTSLTSANKGGNRQTSKKYKFKFNGKDYKTGGYNNISKSATSWLGHDIIQNIINALNFKEKDVDCFKKGLIKFKADKNRDEHQKEIIYKERSKDIESFNELVDANGCKYYVVTYWKKEDIDDLMEYIAKYTKEHNKDYKLEVTITEIS